jgi:GT2 family glycosyltransferase
VEPRVAVVIPSWNARRTLGDAALGACIAGALAQRAVDVHVWLVDNGSDDDTAAWVRATHPAVTVVELSRNRGFAGGVNAGIRAALPTGVVAVALLNNDAIVGPDWLAALVGALDDPTVGIAVAKLVREDGRLDSAGDTLTTWGLPMPRGRDEPDRGQFDGPDDRRVLSASAGATLYRASLLEQVGCFDEAFFAYYEDVDLALRARLVAWEVRYVADAVAVHGVNSTSATVPGLVELHSLKNLVLLWAKDLPLGVLVRLAPKLAIMLAFRIVYTTRAGGPRLTLRALRATARALPGALRARRAIQAGRRLPTAELLALLDHDWRPRAFGGPRTDLGPTTS